MILKKTLPILLIFQFFFLFASNRGLNAGEFNKRPVELQFFVNSHLTTTTKIDYNKNGDVIKMSSFENNRLTDYAKYKYDSDNKLSFENTYSFSGILIRKRKYLYDASGFLTEEKVYSRAGKLTEYLVINYCGKKIDKVEYFRPDNNLFQTLNFNYSGDIISSMIFKKTGKYILIMKAVYDNNMLLIGHDIIHSSADVKIETKYIYEEGYASEQSLQMIFR